MSAAFDPSALTALVVDTNHYQRGISLDMLRTLKIGRLLQADNGADAWDLVASGAPHCIFTDWLEPPIDGLELIRRIRQSDESPNRQATIFLLTNRGSRGDVETARLAGADAFLRKPLSVSALAQRFKAVVTNPQPFVTTATYIGPCRRRKNDKFYLGPRRRLSDKIEGEDPDDSEVKLELAKARIAHLEAQSMKLDPDDPNSGRRVFQAAQDLRDAAIQIEDGALTIAAKELVRYLETLGAAALDYEAMRTHIGAMHQLVHLPNAMQAERIRVAQSLTRMVDKKIRQASAA